MLSPTGCPPLEGLQAGRVLLRQLGWNREIDSRPVVDGSFLFECDSDK